MSRTKRSITFLSQHGPPLPQQNKYRQWILSVLQSEGRSLGKIAFVFVSDETLYQLNRRHLQHETYTDILTFPYNEEPVEAEIFISVERIHDNAQSHKTAPDEELRRVMIHGILHMCGYDDHSRDQQVRMRTAENIYLEQWQD